METETEKTKIQEVIHTYEHKPALFIKDVVECLLKPTGQPKAEFLLLSPAERLEAIKNAELHHSIRLILKLVFYVLSMYFILGLIGQYVLEFI